MQVSATALVEKAIAELLPSRPDLTARVAAEAESSMRELAAERNRHVSSKPELSDIRDTSLGYVELTFIADTEAD